MQRYELVEGSSSKFWEVWTDAATLFVRFGKIGSQGQTKLKKLGDDAAASSEQQKLIAEKTKKGYALVGGGAGKPAPKKTKGNPDLEKAILADPDSADPYLVYGDWLSEQGDPLGELIALDAALAKKKKNPALEKKRDELLSANEESWLGGLADLQDDGDLVLSWKYGFIDSITLGGEEYGEANAAETYTAFRKLPTTKFVRDLTFRLFDTDDGEPSYANLLKAIVKLGIPASLRSLAFDVGDYQTSWTSLGDLSKVYPLVPKLEELEIHVGKMKLGVIELPLLRSFIVRTGGFSKDNLKSVLGATWPKLEKLVLYFGTDEYGGNCSMKDLQPLLDGKGFEHLTHLGLCNAEFENEIAAAIPKAKITKRLKKLDLSKGTMSDVGGQALLDGAKSLVHLEKLDVSQNYLSPAMVKKLKAAFGARLDAKDQGDADDEDDRYVQIAE